MADARWQRPSWWGSPSRLPAFAQKPNIVYIVADDLGWKDVAYHVVDMYPTLLGLAGGSSARAETLDGLNVWPAISEGGFSPQLRRFGQPRRFRDGVDADVKIRDDQQVRDGMDARGRGAGRRILRFPVRLAGILGRVRSGRLDMIVA